MSPQSTQVNLGVGEVTVAEIVAVEPDLDFTQQILGLGAHDLTACYQCGTCSVVCPMSTPQNPFPRKEMVWVQWGLKDLALSNSSIWACHDCAICTTYCPRDAKPAEVMRALREYSIAEYAVPRFIGRALEEPRFLPLLFTVPALILLAVLGSLGHLTALPAGTVVFSKFLPILYIEGIFIVSMGFSLTAAIVGGLRYWRAMCAQMGQPAVPPSQQIVPTLLTIVRHGKFRQCGEELPGTRPSPSAHLRRGHLLAFYAFVGLVITTASVGIGIYAFGYLTPWPLWHPVKLLGNLSGLVLIGALVTFAWRRLVRRQREGKSTYADWLFLTILLLTTLTGFLAQLLRLTGVAELAYPTYVVHLLSVFFLLVYIPYSKFAHLIYRTVAMVYENCARAGHQHPAWVSAHGTQP